MSEVCGGGGGRSISVAPVFLSSRASEPSGEKNHLEMFSTAAVGDSPCPEDPNLWRSTEGSAGVFLSVCPCRTDVNFVLILLSLLVPGCRPLPVACAKLFLTLPGSSGGL